MTPGSTCHLSHLLLVILIAPVPFWSHVYVIERWMLYNNLKLNSDKTELFIFHAKHRPAPPLDYMNIGDLVISSSNSCMNIGVTFDSYMNFDEHTKNICRIAFYYIRNIA